MTTHVHHLFLFVTMAACALALGACRSHKHAMVEPDPGDAVVTCSKCYDQIQRVRSTGGPRAGLASHRTITTHRCEDCKTEMSIYTEEGVLKVRCAKCAPMGLACDKCLPSKGYTPPNLTDEPSAK